MPCFLDFASFRLDKERRQLVRRDTDEVVPLKPKTFEVLLALVERSGETVEKRELMEQLWPDSFVEEANLTQHISLARKALGETASEHRFIVTVPGHGYRFVAQVRAFEVAEESSVQDKGLEPQALQEAAKAAGQPGTGLEPFPATPLEKDSSAEPAPLASQRRRSRPQLRAILLLSLLIGLATAGLYAWRAARSQPEAAPPVIRSLAVLPFRSLNAEAGDEYLGLGMADAIITKLSNLQEINVRPTSNVARYAGPEQDPLAAGRALKVDHVLVGSIQKSGERLRISAQLLRVTDGASLWADSFDEPFSDILVLQDRISLKVSEALRLYIGVTERRIVTRRLTQNAEAYRLYAQARYLMYNSTTPESLHRADELLQRAIEFDPNFALAHAALATTYTFPRPGMTARQAYQRQKEFALRALALDETYHEAHAIVGFAVWRGDYDWARAEAHLRRALELSPNNSGVHNTFGGFVASQGRFDEALAAIARARDLAPINPNHGLLLGFVLIYARRYEDASREFRVILEGSPSNAPALMGLGIAAALMGSHTEAIQHLQRAASIPVRDPGGPPAYLGCVYALAGQRAEALRRIEELKRMENQAGSVAAIYAVLGERDQALAYLEQALENHEWWISTLKVHPFFDNLRDDPRFADLMRRAGIPQ